MNNKLGASHLWVFDHGVVGELEANDLFPLKSMCLDIKISN